MRLAVGLDNLDTPDSIDTLVQAGAGEFFTGFVPREWSERYGWEVPLNRRTFGPHCQFTSLDALGEAIAAAHGHGLECTVAFNAHDYGNARLDQVRDIVRHVDRLEPDALIIADPALLAMLPRWGIDRPIHLSTGIGAFNSRVVRFFAQRYPVRRVVIPRKMTIRDMRTLTERLSDLSLQFEAMIIGYRCNFNDEYCFGLHSGIANNLCADFMDKPTQVSGRFPANWKAVLEDALDRPAAQFEAGSALDRFVAQVDRATPDDQSRGRPRPEEAGLCSRIAASFYGSCGLCVIPQLRDLGIQVLKVPVRGSSWHKISYIQAVHAAVRHGEPDPARCREIINSAAFCSRPGTCYYHVERTSPTG